MLKAVFLSCDTARIIYVSMAALGKEGVQKHVYAMMGFKPHLLAHTRCKKVSKVPKHQ